MSSDSAHTCPIQVPIAIVGLACRLPGNNNTPTAFWKFLLDGKCAGTEPPSSRFNLRGHYDGSLKPGTMRSPGGMFLENIDPNDIDARFFSLSKADAISMDPQQRQLLEVVYEGLENAGLTLGMLKGKSYGCFVGSYASDYNDMQARDPEDRTPSWTVGSAGRTMLSNRISHFLDIKGPSMTVDTACSGSLTSVDLACRYLDSGDIEGAIVAGCNMYLSPEHNMDLSAIRASASPTGRCHTFDAKADGYIKAEAVNMLVLKRVDDALKDRDPIRAIIRGSATNSDGRTPGIASPSSEAQAQAIRRAYQRAGVDDLSKTSYVECHGTGTQAGDPTEANAVALVFSDSRPLGESLIIGSVKSNIGHSEPAAGISGVIKTVLALENGIIPGNPTFVTPNPNIDFSGKRLQATKASLPWPHISSRRASVNSFGYGGSNAHVILDCPDGVFPNSVANHVSSYSTKFNDEFFAEPSIERPRLLVFSANDEMSLKRNYLAVAQHFVDLNVQVDLKNLAYTLSERRSLHIYRSYVVATTTDFDDRYLPVEKVRPEPPKVGFVFTGQGAQWSQMGRGLVEAFPEAQKVLEHLNQILQSLSEPPSWSLIDELIEPRTPEHLQSPDISQSCTTAIQLVQLQLLLAWGIHPQRVIGHSSGEIAAAVAAGYISSEQAIKNAYFRGKAALNLRSPDRPCLGMLAVGLGPLDAQTYLIETSRETRIACVNSPASVTLSGYRSELEAVKSKVEMDGHFARLLKVDLAYHTELMSDIGSEYKRLLLSHENGYRFKNHHAQLYSSVTGRKLDCDTGTDYWQRSMVSPVLFQSALEAMIEDENDQLLIEVGPSGALAGPIAQIKKGLGAVGNKVEYRTSYKRDQSCVEALLEVAGRYFALGGSVNISNVNDYGESDAKLPRVLVDLPNYAWNHSTKYWHESDASKDWRHRTFPQHDLLGSKILSTIWYAPSWRKTLNVNDIPWIRDHKIGNDVVFPAAGYIAMAVEALYQTVQAISCIQVASRVSGMSYRLRDVRFLRALVLEESAVYKLHLALEQMSGIRHSWYRFRISASIQETWHEHCSGLIRIEENNPAVATQSVSERFKHSTSAQGWYKALGDIGYNFGPHFQRQLEVESTAGRRESRVRLDFSDPESPYPQSFYSIHPVCLDGCLQAGVPALWEGHKSAIDTTLVPAIIDDLTICSRPKDLTCGIAYSTSKYKGDGGKEAVKSYKTDVIAYDDKSGLEIFRMVGLSYSEIDAAGKRHGLHTYGKITWMPDVSLLTQAQLDQHLVSTGIGAADRKEQWTRLKSAVALCVHKLPDLSMLELTRDSNPESVWLEMTKDDNVCRKVCRRYIFAPSTPQSQDDARAKYENSIAAEFETFDIARSDHKLVFGEVEFDLVILRLGELSLDDLKDCIENTRGLVRRGGWLLIDITSLLNMEARNGNHLEQSTGHATYPETISTRPVRRCSANDVTNILSINQFTNVLSLQDPKVSSILSPSTFLSTCNEQPHRAHEPEVSLVTLTDSNSIEPGVIQTLRERGWRVSSKEITATESPAEMPVLVLDTFERPLLSMLDADQWSSLKSLISSGHKILWITQGSQFKVRNPHGALFLGFARSARAEDPILVLKTLDIDSKVTSGSFDAIEKILCLIETDTLGMHQREHEYCEREGIIYISRVLTDDAHEQEEDDRTGGAALQPQPFHGNAGCVRLRCEQLGAIASLTYSQISGSDTPLDDGYAEVEIHTAGVNYKDVATATGIVPGSKDGLGLEGAGVVRRVGKRATQYKPGDRVLVDSRGCFANRVHCPVEGLHLLPDWMTFEEAATLCTVYLTAIHALIDRARLQRGQSVLIHSAAGGVGIAAIQVCKYIGAEIFVTVGSDEKRDFLMKAFQIPLGNIFSSRNENFSHGLIEATGSKGIDVILNSLTGDLLDATWRCIADGGVMLEIGKKDMLDRSRLSMEPFCRNASYSALDMSHSSITPNMVADLLSRMFDMISNGNIKPISPVTIFSFAEIPKAFRYMRGGTHMGKIVISNGHQDDIEVLARPAPRLLKLHTERTYLIIGGLKGLCGSLAVYLARNGARFITIMSRSVHDDERSRIVLHDLNALGADVYLVQGDVSDPKDVRQAFEQSKRPVAGIVQGAMVLRDRILDNMTIEDLHDVLDCKVSGSWNLHNIASENKSPLDFFTLLSSASGIIGQKSQANYAAANTFLDSLAAYRNGLDLPACSVDLGVVEDVGYISERETLAARLEQKTWRHGINERRLHEILRTSILEQQEDLCPARLRRAQVITGLPIPLPQDSELLLDARFTGLCFVEEGGRNNLSTADDCPASAQAFLKLVKAKTADYAKLVAGATEIINRQFTKILGLDKAMDPAQPLSVHGLDSLGAVELRNWVRQNLGSATTTLDILHAGSLFALAEKIVGKLENT